MPNSNHPAGEPSRRISSTPQPAATPGGQFDPWSLWVTFRECWPWAMPTGLVLACIAACVVMYNFVPKYKASHLLEANHDYLVFEDVMPAIENLARSEKPILLNSVIIEAVLAKPEVRAVESLSDPMEAEPILREHLSVSSPGTDTQMEISYVDSNAEAAALVCNAVVASYMDKRQSLDTTRISNLERWLDPEIKRWEGIVEMQQEIVQKLSRANRGYEPGVNTPEDGYVPALNNLVGEITTIRIELAVMETTQSTEPASGDPQSTSNGADDIEIELERINPTEVEIEALVKADDAVRDAAAQVVRYRAQLTEMKDNDLKRLNREYFQEIKTKRDAWNTKYKTAAKDARQRAIKWLDERADADLERRKSEARNRIAAEKAQSESNRRQAVTAELLRRGQERGDLLDRLKHLQAEYDRLLAKENLRREEIGGSAADLQFARAELQSATDVLTKLRNRHAAIRTERQSFGAVRTVAAATVPNTPVEKLPFIKMAGASGAVFLIPFLLALLWELKVQPKRTQGIM